MTLFPTVSPQTGPSSATWYLTSYEDGNSSISVLPQTVITAFFDGHGTLSGSAGCNRYTAPYSGSENSLMVSSPASTKMNCVSPAGIMSQEAMYLSKVEEIRQYSVEDNTLILSDAEGKTLLHYTLVSTGTPVPAPLTGTTWYARLFGDTAGQAMSPGGLTTIKLFLSEDGKVYGNAGCNDYVGPYQVTGENSINIGNLQKTKIYCGIGGVMELESAYVSILKNVSSYSVSGDTLLLSDADGIMNIEFDTKYP
jgi:heat shock protein HslJ